MLVGVTRPLRSRSEYWWSLAGGDALQYCLAAGLVSYRLLVFKRGEGRGLEPCGEVDEQLADGVAGSRRAH